MIKMDNIEITLLILLVFFLVFIPFAYWIIMNLEIPIGKKIDGGKK